MNSYNNNGIVDENPPEVNLPLHSAGITAGNYHNRDKTLHDYDGNQSGIGEGGGCPSVPEAHGAPSLSNTCDNSNESSESGQFKVRQRSWAWVKKRRYLIKVEVREFIRSSGGLKNCVFLTFTAPDNCTDKKEWERRVNSMLTGVLRKQCDGKYVIVRERQQRGAWHIHIIAYGGGDVRTGTKWGKDRRGRFCVVRPNEQLKIWWDVCKRIRKKYRGMGRCSAEPLGKNSDEVEKAVGYLCKYVTKDVQGEKNRLISYGKKWPRHTSLKCTMCYESSAKWRLRCESYYEAVKSKFSSVSRDFVYGMVIQILRSNKFDFKKTIEEIDTVIKSTQRVSNDVPLFPSMWSSELLRPYDRDRVYTAIPMMGYHEGSWHRLTAVNGVKPLDNPYSQAERPPG